MWQSLAETHFLLNAQSPSLSFFLYHSRVKLIYFSFWNQDYTLNTVFLGRMPHHFHQSHLYFKPWSPRRPCKRRSSLDCESSVQIHTPTLIYFIYQDITFYFPLFSLLNGHFSKCIAHLKVYSLICCALFIHPLNHNYNQDNEHINNSKYISVAFWNPFFELFSLSHSK